MSKRPHPILLALLIAIMVASWSLNFVFGKVGLRYLAPLPLASFRVVLAGLLMVPVYFLFAPRGRAGASAMPILRFHRRNFWTLVQLGFLGVVVNQICFTVGLNYTTVGHSALIIGMGPIVILLLAWMKGLEALTVKKMLGMAISFAGVTLLALEHGISLRSGTLRGDLITFAGSLGFALFTVQGKPVAEAYDSVTINAFNYFIGAVMVLPLAIQQAMVLSRAGGWTTVAWQGWAVLVFMAVFASVLAYLIYFWALGHMAASRLSAFSYLHPVITTAMGVGLLGEKLTRNLLVGGTLVLVGVYLVEAGREDQRSETHVSL